MIVHWSPTETMARDRRQRLEGQAAEHRLAKLARRARRRAVADPEPARVFAPAPVDEPAIPTPV